MVQAGNRLAGPDPATVGGSARRLKVPPEGVLRYISVPPVIADARSLSDGQTVEADVCIVGAGPMGLTLARELAGDGLRLCVLESAGGEGPTEPLDGEVVGEYYPPLAETRARGLGGTAVLWEAELTRTVLGARFGTLGAIDFEQRDDVPYSGWPFDRTSLEPYYERAARICELGPLSDDPAAWQAPPRVVPLALGSHVTTRIAFHGPRSVFLETLPDWASKAPDVSVYLQARALEIETNGQDASCIVAGSGPPHRFRVSARLFVLALGGIENARLLLLSNGDAGGLGNEHDLVGRFLMDHPTATSVLVPANPAVVERLGLYDTLHRDATVAMGILELSEETLRREGLLSSGTFLVPRIERQMRALQSLREAQTAVRSKRLPDRPLATSGNVVLGADAVAARFYRHLVDRWPALEKTTSLWPTTRLLNTLGVGPISGWSRLPLAGRRYKALAVYQVIEQAPEPERRITLSAAKDDFGLPLPRLHWFISERELDSMRRTQDVLAAAFQRAGTGRLVTTEDLARTDTHAHIHPTAHHHLGTTRMNAEARHGVVDGDCRVHGTPNLFVTGTSIFPTGGYINPTLTAIALTVRLADHVKMVFRSLPERSPR